MKDATEFLSPLLLRRRDRWTSTMHSFLSIRLFGGGAIRSRITGLVFGMVLAVGIASATPGLADDLDALLNDAASDGKVPVIVTGWQSITGNGDDFFGVDEGGYESLDGNDFIEELEQKGVGLQDVRTFDLAPIVAMRVPVADLQTVKGSRSGIEVYRDAEMTLQLASSTGMIHAGRVNESGYTGAGTVVAVLDSGVDVEHPFFGTRTMGELCVSDLCPDGTIEMVGPGAARPDPKRTGSLHGTHVAGIVLGRGEKFTGIAPESELFAINLQDRNGRLRASSVIRALEVVHALKTEQGIPIAAVNMSFGEPCQADRILQTYNLVVKRLTQAGIALVAATGNQGAKDAVMRPACAAEVVSVGSIGAAYAVTAYSNSSRQLDLLAPGGDQSREMEGGILSSVPGGAFQYLQGTSMAAPHVAGAFAVMRQALPDASVAELAAALKKTGRPVTDVNGVTRPAIDIAAALESLGVSLADGPTAPARDPGDSPTPPAPGGEPGAPRPEGDDGWKTL